MPRRCLHGVHLVHHGQQLVDLLLTLPRRCLHGVHRNLIYLLPSSFTPLPRRCLHGCICSEIMEVGAWMTFASALPARVHHAII